MTSDEGYDPSLTFACSCDPAGKQKCDDVLDWAKDFLNANPRNFLTKAIYNLDILWDARIIDLPVDQWGAVVARSNIMEDGKPEFSSYTQCDEFEYGLAFTVRRFYNRYGDKRHAD